MSYSMMKNGVRKRYALSAIDRNIPSKRVDTGREKTDKPRRTRTNPRVAALSRNFEGPYEYIRIDQNGKELIEGEDATTRSIPIMREAFDRVDLHRRLASYCDPDAFDMHINNDHFGNGVIQCIEMILKQLTPALTKDFNFHEAWAVVSALQNLLLHDVHDGVWTNVEDSKRVGELTGLIGCAFLSTLNALDRIDQLKVDSDFQDLGFVMVNRRRGACLRPFSWFSNVYAICLLFMLHSQAKYLEFSVFASELAISTEYNNNGAVVDWQMAIFQYAAEAEINLADQGVSGIEELVAEDGGTLGLYPGKATSTRWNWLKTLNTYREEHADGCMRSTLGAWYDQYNILKMDVGKRTQYHLDKKDPLAHVPHKERLRVASGNLIVEVEELMGEWHYAYGLREPDRPQQILNRRKKAPVSRVRRQASPLEDPSTRFGLTAHTTTIHLPGVHSPAVTITRSFRRWDSGK